MIIIEKPKPPKNFSYVMKTSVLEKALQEAKIELFFHLIYRHPQSGGSILQAYYLLPNKNVDYPRVYTRAGTVPSSERKQAFKELENRIIPSFIRWLTNILHLPDNSTKLMKQPFFDATYNQGLIKIYSNINLI